MVRDVLFDTYGLGDIHSLVIASQESKTIEEFSGIPLAALKRGDETVTKIDLRNSGCGPLEAMLLGALLKVPVIYLSLHNCPPPSPSPPPCT